MNAKPTFARPRPTTLAAAAFLSAAIGVGILGSVAGLFQSRGMPLAELAAAERACANEAYVSDRQACVNERVAATRGARVANR
jgi:hypothetical protein